MEKENISKVVEKNMKILLIKQLNSRGMPEQNMLELTVEMWRVVHGIDDKMHNGRQAMVDFWLNNPILLGWVEDHEWDVNLDKDVYVA